MVLHRDVDAEVTIGRAAHALQEVLHGAVDLAAQPEEDSEGQGDDDEERYHCDNDNLLLLGFAEFFLRLCVADAVFRILIDGGDGLVKGLDDIVRKDWLPPFAIFNLPVVSTLIDTFFTVFSIANTLTGK